MSWWRVCVTTQLRLSCLRGAGRTLGVEVEHLYFAPWCLKRLWLVGMFMVIAARFVADFRGRVFITLAVSTTGWARVRTLNGGEHIFSVHLTHTGLAFALHLAALAAWLYNRRGGTGVLTALAFYLNAMTTAPLILFLLLLLLLCDDRWQRRTPRVSGSSCVFAEGALLCEGDGCGRVARHQRRFRGCRPQRED